MQTKIDIIKALLIGIDTQAKVRLLVPSMELLNEEEFREIDMRIVEVHPNTVNGWRVEIIK